MRLLLQLKNGRFDAVAPFPIKIALLVIFLAALFSYGLLSRDATEESACMLQVREHALFLEVTAQQFESSLTACEREDVIIEKKQDASKEIAELMAKCWRNFGQGKLNLFSDENIFCHTCNTVKFQEEGFEKDLGSYLLTHQIPFENVSYLEYLVGATSDEAFQVKDLRKAYESLSEDQKSGFLAQEIDKSKLYSVNFVYAKGHNSIKQIGEHLMAKTTAGKVGGSIAVLGLGASAGGYGTGIVFSFLGLSNPIGWVVTAGVVVAVAAETVTYLYSDAAEHEWVSLIVFTEQTSEELEGLNCKYAPI